MVKNNFFSIDPSKFRFVLSEAATKCDTLVDAVKRYRALVFSSDCSMLKSSNRSSNLAQRGALNKFRNDPDYGGELNELLVSYAGFCPQYPLSNMSEIYTIRVKYGDRQDALLYGEEVWGVLRGLETFSQMVYQREASFLVNSTFIIDYPRFPVRGIMLDTSRHFIPMSHLLESLDAMAYNKMNVFHWHIVDDQAFPYVSKKYPKMSELGAFRPTHIYTQADVGEVIEYARKRGIRVLIEFDTPGHTLSWGKAIKDLLTTCYRGSQPDGTFGPIDPTQNNTYQFLRDFFAEIVSVWPDDYVHLGGDEVDFNCWKSNPGIKDFMKQEGIEDYSKLESFYMQKLVRIVENLRKEYIVWQEVYDNGVHLGKNAVVHVWKHFGTFDYLQELKNITENGYRAIVSAPWYLNYISYGADWPKYYSEEPLNFQGSRKQKALVMGGIACMWGEFVDGTNVISRTW